MLFELKFCRQHDCTLDALGIFGNYREPIFIKITDDGLGSWVQAKAAGIDEQALRMLRAARDAYYQEYLRTEAIEIEGVVEALAELSRYARMAIVTTSKHMDF